MTPNTDPPEDTAQTRSLQRGRQALHDSIIAAVPAPPSPAVSGHTPMTLRIIGPNGEPIETTIQVPISMLIDRSAATLAVVGFRLALGNAVNHLLDSWVAQLPAGVRKPGKL